MDVQTPCLMKPFLKDHFCHPGYEYGPVVELTCLCCEDILLFIYAFTKRCDLVLTYPTTSNQHFHAVFVTFAGVVFYIVNVPSDIIVKADLIVFVNYLFC